MTQNWSILAKFAKKNPTKSAVFYWLFLGEVSPWNFPWNRPIFLWIYPENPLKFDFFPLKCRKIGRFFCEFWLFSREISRFFRKFWLFRAKSADFSANFAFFSRENPAKSADFSANLPLKIQRNFAFFPRNIRSPANGNFYFLQSSGQGGTQLLSTSTCWLVNLKKERDVFYLRLTVMETWV